MRKIFFALLFIASMLCFAVAQAQSGTVQLGSYLTTVYNSIPGGLQVAKNVKLSQYAATLSAGDTVILYLTRDSLLRAIPLSYVKGSGGGGSADSSIFETRYRTDTAKVNLRAQIAAMSGGGADSGIFQTNYRADTAKAAIYLYLWNLSDTAQALLDSVFALRGGIETNAAGIAYNLTRINSLSDSVGANRDSINIHRTAIDGKEPTITPGTADQYWQGDKTWQPKSGLPISTAAQTALDGKISYTDTPTIVATQDYVNNAIADIPPDTIPSWQAVLDAGNTGDSVVVSNKLFVGTTEDYKPISIQVIGDSRDAAVLGGIAPLKIWPQRVANLMGANLNQALAQPSTFFMNKEPRYNPLDDTSAVMDVILTGKIKNVTGLSDSDYYLFVTRCINDLHWYTTEDSGYNYTPENFGRDYRIFMDSVVGWGYDMDKVVLMGPKYVLPTSTMVVQDSVFRWIDTVRQIASDYGCKFFDAFHWEEGRGGASLLDIDNFHENETGHAVLTKGMIVTIDAPVKRNGQNFAVNGVAEFNRIKFRGGNDSSTQNSFVMMVNANGEVYTSGNKVIWNNSPDSLRQEADINVSKIKGRSLEATGVNSVSLKIGNNTAIQGGAASNGVVYLDASSNTTGTVNIRAGSTTTFNATEVSSTVPFRSALMWVGTAVQGNSASGGTLYVDASKNTTGTVNIRAGSTTTFNSSGITATAITQTGAHTINNNWQVGTDGKLKEYGNAAPANGQILIGDSTDMELATLTAGSGISITNGAGSITIAATGGGGGGLLDSIRISNDSLYQCAGGTCTYVGMVNIGGGGSGTVTSVTATDGNGFDFTVANTTTTPVISATLQSNYNFVTDAEKAAIGSLATDYVSLAGSYSNPTWVTGLAWSKISGTPTTLSGYGITDAVPNTRTINGNALSSNVTLDIDDVAPTQTGNANKILTTDGTNATWQAPAVGVTVNTQTGTTYTILSSDNGKIIEFTNSSAVTVTLPSGLGTTFTCIIRQNGTGDVTLATSGTTVNNANSHTSTRAQYSAFAILPTGTANTFITQGDMD